MESKLEILVADDLESYLQLNSVFETVFGTNRKKKPNLGHARFILLGENFIVIVAKVDGMIVGGLTIFMIDQYVINHPSAFVHDIAILEEYQGKGIGKKLMEFTVKYCRKFKFKDVFVLANKEDQHSIEFYRSISPSTEEKVIQFTYNC
ncbi:GNAT family N-acetyltransferase [Algoriphagus terrigena]|uniref:GNAT family N-acetyltransferase n=1 Tax=Algoriphagus terrigena TaxID=344884 RepID=UPI000408A93C|nr:GNAT family N-acetyltransferase [Algoriphagus terrigena]